MGKFRTMLVGIALALPFAALNTASAVEGVQPAEGAVAPAGIEMASTAYECCWVFYMGRWYCVPNC